MRCNNCVVDDTDRTDCWRRRTGGERSVTAGVSRRSNQNSNWMWWAYWSSDSSRQCHSVANSKADRLSGLRQSYHPQHTLHELRARRLSEIHSAVNLYSTTSDLKKVSRNRRPHTVANRCKQVNTARKTKSAAEQQATATQLRCAAYVYTGTNSDWYEYICKYVNQRPYWTLW